MIMNSPKQTFGFNQKLLVIALFAAFGPAHADTDIATLTKPDSTVVSAGLAGVTGDRYDRTIFGQYNGWNKPGGGLLLDFSVVKRDDATGTWLKADGRDLGLDSRELSFSREKQGAWQYSAEYSELVHHDLRTINTGMLGFGSTTPIVSSLATAGSGSNQNLESKRRGVTLGAKMWLRPDLMFEASYKAENKTGTRQSGVGTYCSNAISAASGYACGATAGALLMLAEPLSSTTNQFEAKLNFLGNGYNATVGYYGSFYNNDRGSLLPSVGTNLWNLGGTALNRATDPGATLVGFLQQPVALPPDNQAHQFYVSGNYVITPTIRSNFNVSYSQATQNESFSGMGLSGAPAGRSDLGAKVENTLVQFGLTARPLPKLSMLANWRYEDINDKTPVALYNGASTNTGLSSQKAKGKAEASYQLSGDLTATLGADYDWVKRQLPVATTLIPATSLSSLREWTEELGYRAELRKSMSDKLNATVAYVHSWREGSHWINLGPTSALYPAPYQVVTYGDAYSANGTFPFTMTDLKRDKVRAMVDWMPTDDLSLQFTLEDGRDNYAAPSEKGLHDTGMRSYGVDASWTLSDKVKLTGYVNQTRQTLHVDHNAGYVANLDNLATSVGLGVVGKPSGVLDLGADLAYLDDSNRYGLGSGNASAAGVLPDVSYRMTTLKLYGKYALNNSADVRVDLVHQNAKLNEWTWGYAGVPFAYSDNTTVSLQPNQSVTYLGVRYVFKIR